MGGLAWQFRCIPAATNLTLFVLFLIAFGDFHYPLPRKLPLPRKWHNGETRDELHATARAAVQWVVALCMVLVQLLACVYPLRLCWATFQTTREIATLVDHRGHNDLAKSTELLAGSGRSPPLIHAILVPSYKETIETLKETLNVLASHRSAKRRYDVFLAMEELDPNAETVAMTLIQAFQGRFRDIQNTLHPARLPGEAQGKSSNISWAARRVSEKYPDGDNTIVTVIDADTNLSPTYFGQLARMFREDQILQLSVTCLYMPPIVFDRNAHKVPPLVRMADLLWCGAALSGSYPGTSIAPPASVYSVPLALVNRVGGWDTGPEAIGEDLHMYLKCYFATRGELNIRPIYSPASQCNSSSEELGFRGVVGSLRARWKQAVRHMWGSLDTGYAVQQVWKLLGRGGGKENWKVRSYLHLFILFHRLFEAHFLPSLLPLSVLSSIIYPWFIPSVITPWPLLFAFHCTAHLRNIAFCIMLFWFYLYEHYHWICLTLREVEMCKAGLYDETDFSPRRGSWYWMDWFFFPVAGLIFGFCPMVVAQWSHLWTEHLVYHVTAKPVRSGRSGQNVFGGPVGRAVPKLDV